MNGWEAVEYLSPTGRHWALEHMGKPICKGGVGQWDMGGVCQQHDEPSQPIHPASTLMVLGDLKATGRGGLNRAASRA